MSKSLDFTLSVSEFVALCNQTLEYAYPTVTITGELANFRISRNRWVYFDLKDEASSIKCFGTVYQLPGPLDDGMMLAVKGAPRLHPQYGFSINVLSLQPVGEGTIKKAAALLRAKLEAEGLFDPARKRALPYPPAHIGLITSKESAAFHDFTKILDARWGGVTTTLVDTQVQGEAAPAQIVSAIEQLNQLPSPPDVLVLTRGGGSAEDLQAFSTEHVARAVAASRVPTMVAIGHEVDVCLAELAADQRASTPSNAAELLVPDRRALAHAVVYAREQLGVLAEQVLAAKRRAVQLAQEDMVASAERVLAQARQQLTTRHQVLEAFNPRTVLARGYAAIRLHGAPVRSGSQLKTGDTLELRLQDTRIHATVNQIVKE